MTEPNTTAIDSFLRVLWDRQATDLLLTAGAPPLMRIDGALLPVPDAQRLTADDTAGLVGSLLGDELSVRLETELEVDFSFAWETVARFRANAFHQRGTIALSLRLIPNDIPSFEDLGLPPVFERIVR